MKREGNLENFAFYRPQYDHGLILKFEAHDDSDIEVKDANRSLLEAIYAPDPISGWPTGDIACYVSDKTSPAVKDFIKANLMIDVSSARLPSVPADVDDSVVLQLSRHGSESMYEYADRINRLMQSDTEFLRQVASKPKEVSVDE